MYLYFSVDGGRTFEELNGPWGALNTPEMIGVDGNRVYFTNPGAKTSFTIELRPGLRLSKRGEDFVGEPIPADEVLRRAASPSGETKFQCREK